MICIQSIKKINIRFFTTMLTQNQLSTQNPSEFTNWGKTIISHPKIVVKPKTLDDLILIIRDTQTYPSPIRAIGSNHSTTQCAVADGGTVVDMTGFNQILEINTEAKTVTVQAGALYLDVAEELRKQGLQFFVNVELGNLSMGSAACGGTKDASMPGEFGQVCSYAISLKMVTPQGKPIEINEEQPELLRIARSSYGLLGIVYEVTFKVRPARPMALRHKVYQLEEFICALPNMINRPLEQQESIMLYLFPFLDEVAVEFRQYQEEGKTSGSLLWDLRNWTWSSLAPGLSYLLTRLMPIKTFRYGLIDQFNQKVQLVMEKILKNPSGTSATDQIIRYPDESDWKKYTFSIWAFPEAEYPAILRAYFEFCRNYYKEQGYRCNMLNVAYRILQDDSSLFSYSSDSNVMTLDPVSTGDPGWGDFITAYNEFCSQYGGVPLFNQTRGITPQQVEKAFGDRLATFEQYRQQYDPHDRMLNQYFRDRLQGTLISSQQNA
ncbi:unknown [Crocosphaera subtropica ATCC 51142]|uniref:FAD-binding PCMH-type domain-containing protein n=2 Tax=Crocosphaera TaxID=263510 RepID=B1WSS5_CROS5|nr:unknown [Crocosphaera subtropica ATCC 51142]